VGHNANKVYKRRVTDLSDFKHRIKTEWTKLDHAVIAASVHHWRLCPSRLATVISSTVFGFDVLQRQLRPFVLSLLTSWTIAR